MSAPADPEGRSAAGRDRPSRPSLRRTTLAFALAPGIAAAACAGYLALRSLPDATGTGGWRDLAAVGEAAAASGYAAAAVFGVPFYALLPARLRGTLAATVPLGAASAAAPWLLVFALCSSDRPFSLGLAGFAAAFGAVGGFAFWAIRRRWRP